MSMFLRSLAGLLLPLLIVSAHAQSLQALRNDSATPGDVLTYGMGYENPLAPAGGSP